MGEARQALPHCPEPVKTGRVELWFRNVLGASENQSAPVPKFRAEDVAYTVRKWGLRVLKAGAKVVKRLETTG